MTHVHPFLAHRSRIAVLPSRSGAPAPRGCRRARTQIGGPVCGLAGTAGPGSSTTASVAWKGRKASHRREVANGIASRTKGL
jgi:hypothetical protein